MIRLSTLSPLDRRYTRAQGLHPTQRAPGLVVRVEPVAQLFARLEEGHEFLSNGNRIARARIAALTRSAMLDGEGAEATQLDAVALRKRVDDLVKHDVDDAL